MEETKQSGTPKEEKAPVPADMNAVLQRLEAMEKLLEKQADAAQKTARSRAISAVLMLALVVVMALGIYALERTLTTATSQLPQLIDTTTKSVQQLEVTLRDISKIDFEAMNGAISEIESGVASIDFTALNSSIEELNKVVKALSSVAGFFG